VYSGPSPCTRGAFGDESAFLVPPKRLSFQQLMRATLFIFSFSETTTLVSAVRGSSVELPCNVTAPLPGDKVRLVLFFKGEDSSKPIYT